MSVLVCRTTAVIASAMLVLQLVEIAPTKGKMSPVCKTIHKTLPALELTWQWNELTMLGSSNFLLLEVNAVSDFGLALVPSEDNHDYEMYYRVWLGITSDKLSIISRGSDLNPAYYVGNILSSNRYFYVYWSDGFVQVGTGWHIGRNELMNYTDPLPPLAINYLGLSSRAFAATANLTICPSVPVVDQMLPTNAPSFSLDLPSQLSCGQVCFSDASCTGFALLRNSHLVGGNISCSIYYALDNWQFDETHVTYLINNFTYFMN